MIKIGNLATAPYDKQIYVYDGKTLKVKAGIVMPDDTVISNETMAEHYIQFSFHIDIRMSFKRTDYIKYNDVIYRLREDCQPTEVHLNHYTYELKLEAPEMFFQDCIMFYTMQGYKEVEWVFFGKATQFIEIAADNVSTYLSEDWKPGIIEPNDFDLQNISFSSHNVFDALTEIAEAFGAEWYVDYTLKTINLVYKREFGNAITLRRETELIDIKKAKDSELEYCTRLFAFGSTRNIPKNYRNIDEGGVVDAIVQKKLRLPVNVGDYIDAYPNIDDLEIIERVKVFEDIYPKRIGNITSLRTVEKKDEGGNPFIIYYFKDSGLNFKSEYILQNETLMLQFGNNSWLNGRDFELSYNDRTEEFEIINIEEGENYVPNEILKPKVGDEYVLYGFDISLVGDQYVPLAEAELEAAAREYLATIAADTATYTCTVNPVYRFENNLDLPIGQKVVLKSLMFESGEKESRIYGYRKFPVIGKDEYVVGDVMDYKRLARMENETEENKKVADVQYLEAMKLANGSLKSVKALNYLRVALENETMIDKGLLLTTLIRLGAMVGNEWIEKAGINGAAMDADEVVAYFGGSLDEAILGLASIIFKMDGSGHLAKGNISWDALGNLLMRGMFESNDSGNRIIIDPDDRSIKMLNPDNKEIFKLNFITAISGGNEYIIPKLVMNHWVGNSIEYWCELTGYECRFFDKLGNQSYIRPDDIGAFNPDGSWGFGFGDDGDKLSLSAMNLPTSPTGLSPGKVWRDGTLLRIVV